MRLKRAKDTDRQVNIPEGELRHFYEEQKLTTGQIAQIYGCGAATVKLRLHHLGITLRPPGRARINASEEELNDLYTRQGLSLRQIASRLECDHSTLHKRLYKHGIAARSYSEANRIYPRQDFNGNACDKAYMIGFRLGDLYVTTLGKNDTTVVVNCSTTKSEQLELITSLFQPYGHVQLGSPNRKGCRGITCYLNPTFSFLLPKTDEVPVWIQSDDECAVAFAAGYIDAEGSFLLTGKEARFAVSSYDENIIHWLGQVFNNLGVECRPPYLAGKKGYVRPNGSIYRKDLWTLSVARVKSLLHLTTLIVPHLKHAKRKRDAQLVKANVEARLRNRV
jgi:hypothetical protein